MQQKKIIKSILIAVLPVLLLSSCVSRKEIVYFQGLEEAEQQLATNQQGNLTLKPNDLLTISVTAPEQEAALPFNLPVVGATNILDASSVSGQPKLQSYLVDGDGNIEFPVLGIVKVVGFTRQQLASSLKEKISKYVQDPILNIRIINFQVSVLGEVARPGTFSINDEYLSLPKALGLAGDMTIYGLRNNVLVMREENGKKTHAYLDLTNANIINSPYYYLKQNDVVYIEPNGAQRQASSYNRNTSVYISIASVLVSLIVLISR
ncbi:MAG: polysaccharide biosynthesis/export family protein [Leeuwenhoekiella sp.]